MISTTPQNARAAAALPIYKPPVGGCERLILQSPSVAFIATHWFGRQLACSGVGCPGCDLQDARTRGYVIALRQARQGFHPVLIEAAPSAFDRLNGFCELECYRLTTGLLFDASKRSKRSPLRLEPVGMEGTVELAFSSRQRLLRAVAVVHSLPLPRIEEAESDWEKRVAPSALALLSGAIAAG